MTFHINLSRFDPILAQVSNRRCFGLVILIWLADWLFFAHEVGVSWTVFVSALALCASLVPQRRVDTVTARMAVFALLTGLLPSLQAFNLLALAWSLAGVIAFTVLMNGGFRGDLLAQLRSAVTFSARIPIGLFVDAIRMATHHRRDRRRWFWPASASGWIVPIALSTVFVGLFAEANPLIGGWIAQIDLVGFFDTGNFVRPWYWLASALFCWPFLRVRLAKFRTEPVRAEKAPESVMSCTSLDTLFSEQAVFRSFLLFNGLFGLQNGLDAAFLWGGAELPEGMTYASYAHRGAYTLILTALMAAGFVLFATRSGAPSEHSSRVRWLLLVWTAQNAVLVQYCVVRLNLYVDAYALTYWRVAAFAWMALVFAGLVLIFIKFFWNKSTRWLINTNLICLMAVLFGAGNANLPGWISQHNTRLPELGQTRVLDPAYLATLGPAALPAIDRVLANSERYAMGGSQRSQVEALLLLSQGRIRLVHQVRRRAADWRAWGWRHQRTKRYLAQLQSPERLAPWRLDRHK